MLAVILAIGLATNACPMTIGVGRDGTLFSARFNGWYKTSPRTLESDLEAGCYNDADPSRVTFVKLAIASQAPKSRVDLVFSILEKEGWPRARVSIESWSGYPREPH
jgi:hypothetical protein